MTAASRSRSSSASPGSADQDVAFTADYPIGENVELVSVSLRGLTCTCTGLLAEQEDPPAPAENPPAQD